MRETVTAVKIFFCIDFHFLSVSVPIPIHALLVSSAKTELTVVPEGYQLIRFLNQWLQSHTVGIT